MIQTAGPETAAEVVQAKRILIPANDAPDFELCGFHLAAAKNPRDPVRAEAIGVNGLSTSVEVVV
jgi:hypothetical protein